MGVKVCVTKDYDAMSRTAAYIVAETLRYNPCSVFCMPTGGTPKGMYEDLSKMCGCGALDFSDATIFHLDNYYGLTAGHPQSYCTYMKEHFLKHANVKRGNVCMIDSGMQDMEDYCKSIDDRIYRAGGFDLCVLGIGTDGHIAFNMPGSPFDSRTRMVELSEQTIRDNSRFFDGRTEDVPRRAITVGTATIMESRRVMLLANGERKADAVAAALEGPVTEQVPASVLQKHEDALFVIDKAAASRLSSDFC